MKVRIVLTAVAGDQFEKQITYICKHDCKLNYIFYQFVLHCVCLARPRVLSE